MWVSADQSDELQFSYLEKAAKISAPSFTLPCGNKIRPHLAHTLGNVLAALEAGRALGLTSSGVETQPVAAGSAT